MRQILHLPNSASQNFFGTRYSATSLREELSRLLSDHNEVEIDFSGVGVSQSFMDELIGLLVLAQGPDLLRRLIFRGCSEDVKAIISFVVNDRAQQYVTSTMH